LGVMASATFSAGLNLIVFISLPAETCRPVTVEHQCIPKFLLVEV
jgi:hypothetical protein